MPILEQIAAYTQTLITNKQCLVSVEPIDLVAITDESIVIIILRNLVDNALKEMQEGTLLIKAYASSANQTTILVKDSGPGLPDYLINKLANNILEAELHESLSGFGYKLVYSLTDMINASIVIRNKDGLEVHLILPKENS